MINYFKLTTALKKLGHPPTTWLPLDYQSKNVGGGGRTTHDDWVLFKSTPRIDTAYAVPLPFRKLAGNAEPQWVPLWNPNYPLLPEAQTKDIQLWREDIGNYMQRHVLTMT